MATKSAIESRKRVGSARRNEGRAATPERDAPPHSQVTRHAKRRAVNGNNTTTEFIGDCLLFMAQAIKSGAAVSAFRETIRAFRRPPR